MKPILMKWSQKRWLTCLLLVLAALGIGFISLCFTVTSRRWEMMHTYFRRPLLVLLNLLPPVLLTFFFWFLTNRAVVAYGLTGLLVFVLTAANFFKLTFRDDPLMFGDLFLAQEAGNMLGRYSLFINKPMAASLILFLLGGVFLFFFARGRLPKCWPRFALAGAVLILCLPISGLYTSNNICNNKTQNFDIINRWSSTQVYTSKGFLYPFLHSTVSAFDKAPENYNKTETEAVLAQLSSADIPEDKKVNVLGIMLEAYNDFSKYDQIAFSQDVYAEYHALEKESIRGNLITSIFAGGTVTTERSFVTGLSDLSSFRRLTNSYAWYFAEQDYTVTGSHPCYQWFYNRLNIDPNLGFQGYLFYEDHYAALADGGIARDNIFLPELARLYDAHRAQSDNPYFSFSVTYQGHGPYSTDSNQWEEEYVRPGTYTQETENILNNYFGSVKSTGQELLSFVDHFRDLEDPIVLVVFGDHNPWLGDGNSVYTELGIDLDTAQMPGFLNYYGTRYLIWANDSAKKVLGNDFVGEGPDISPNFLMNELFELCGWQGDAYMQYTDQVREQLPVIQTGGRCITRDGELLQSTDDTYNETLAQFKQVEYYRRTNFLYQDVQKGRESP